MEAITREELEGMMIEAKTPEQGNYNYGVWDAVNYVNRKFSWLQLVLNKLEKENPDIFNDIMDSLEERRYYGKGRDYNRKKER